MTYPITWKGCHSGNYRVGRDGLRPLAIVNHRMVGYLNGTDRHFANYDPDHPVSTHFGIGTRYAHGPVEISQYVNLSDTAFGNGNWDSSGMWDSYYPTDRVNARTISIEHQDGGTAGRGIVTDAIIEASIWLNRALLTGDVSYLRSLGIRIREPYTPLEPGPRTVIDHHWIAGRLKPYCWQPWLDDDGFPQARYLLALEGVPDTSTEDPMIEVKFERWRRKADGVLLTSLGAPRVADGTVDYTRRLVLFSGPGGQPRFTRWVARTELEPVDGGDAATLNEPTWDVLTTWSLPPDDTPFDEADLNLARSQARAAELARWETWVGTRPK